MMYRSPKEMRLEYAKVVFDFTPYVVTLDDANNGWFDPLTRVVSDRYSGETRRVPAHLTGDAMYEAAIELHRKIRLTR